MRAKLALLCISAAGVLAVAGCQTYDFEPVDPLSVRQTEVEREIVTRQNVPNLMLLVDTSDSMDAFIDPACTAAGCATRWSDLKASMGTFLSATGTLARTGLVTFPQPPAGTGPSDVAGLCTSATSVQRALPTSDVEADLVAQASSINTLLQGIGPAQTSGGTPTAASLSFVGTLEAMKDPSRQNLVLLLTDGLPNCNANNPNDPSAPAACQCTSSSCSGLGRYGCLDQGASVSAVEQLKAAGIDTFVVGFGAETGSGAGSDTLNQMALAGGRERECNGAPCERAYYQAANQAELTAALEAITADIGVNEPCFYEFDPAQMPSDESLIAVYLSENGPIGAGDVRLERGPGRWNLVTSPSPRPDGKTGVLFDGASCTLIETATPSQPVWVSIRAVSVN